MKFRIYDKKYNNYIQEPFYKITLAKDGQVYNSEEDQWYGFDERYILELSTNIFDENNKEIHINDKVMYWSFYRNSGSSEDWFGTEPQNSYKVYEEYLEQKEGLIIYEYGCFWIQNKNEKIPLYLIISGLGSDIFDYYIYEEGGDFTDFLENCEEFLTADELEELNSNSISPENEDFIKNLFNKHTSRLIVTGNIH